MTRLRRTLAERIWSSLHEPRPVTAAMVAVYLVVATVGALMLVESIPVMWHAPYRQIEAAILLAAGVVGAPTAWLGRWYIERAACLAWTGVGGIMAVTLIADHWREMLTHPVTAATAIGVASWVALGLTRWVRVSHQPYAPGRGPVPTSVQEEIAAEVVRRAKEV